MKYCNLTTLKSHYKMSSPVSHQNTAAPERQTKPIIFSMCIPRVFKNISKKRILAILYSLKVGFVERLDMVRSLQRVERP